MQHHHGLYILLAAGFSRRFGSPKLLQALPSGNTIISSSITALQRSSYKFVVAIREGDNKLLEHVDALNADIIRVNKAAEGLSSVIAECSMKIETSHFNYIGICLGDMPYIDPKTFETLNRHSSSTHIVRPQYKDKLGHPVLFGRDFFSSLYQLEGDTGAKSIIQAHPDKLLSVKVDDSMILYDIDVPTDII